MGLIRQWGNVNRYAASKDSAAYQLEVNAVYQRRLSDSQGGLVSMVVDDNTILASVDLGYKVQVKRGSAEVLHFAQGCNGLQPAGGRGSGASYEDHAGGDHQQRQLGCGEPLHSHSV